MITEEQLKEWEEIEKKATPEPWETFWLCNNAWSLWGPQVPFQGNEDFLEEDARFIAMARTVLPLLIEEVRRLRKKDNYPEWGVK